MEELFSEIEKSIGSSCTHPGELLSEIEKSIVRSCTHPGFRFSPTDEELILHYLNYKMQGQEEYVEIISEIEIWNYEPWELPAISVLQSDTEWFFFTRMRYSEESEGSLRIRATNMGYWRPTGKELAIKSGDNLIGKRRTLAYYTGSTAPTEWVMHEFCMIRDNQEYYMHVYRVKRKTEVPFNNFPSEREEIEEYVLRNIPRHPSSVPEGINAAGGFSNELSSYNPRRVEDDDSEYISFDRFIHEFFQRNSPGDCNNCDFEERFAEIMNDDNKNTLPMVPATNPKAKGKELVIEPSFESLSVGRTKLKKRKPNTYHGETSEVNRPKQEPKPFPTMLANERSYGQYRRLIWLLLVVLTLLVLCIYYVWGDHGK